MKKLFTTFLLMGVALTGWASITSEWNGNGELKIVYHEGDNLDEVKNTLGNYNGQVKKLVLEGVFTNKNFSDIGDNIGNCAHSDGIVLDLSGCSNLVSKVVRADGTYDSDIDWVTTEHMFLPNSNPITVSGTATKKTKYLIYGQNDYSGPVFQNPADEKFYPNENYNSWEVLTPNGFMYVDENGKQLPDGSVDPNTLTYEYTYTPDATQFKLGNFKKKVIGLYLPNSENFNYVPDGLCKDMNGVGDNGNLKELGLGDHIEWIGQEAFCNCISLKDPVFPATMKVFAGDCFKNCNSFTKVDLSILPKIQIVDYMAFGSDTSDDPAVATSNLAEFILPTNNTSLKYFANYVVRGTKVTELDFSGCNGIVNFAHDGKATFGEFSPNWKSYWTFYACPELTTVTLPRNLSYLTKQAFDHCPKLQSVTFLGDAEYDEATCVEGGTNTIKNPLVIDDEAFAKDNALSEVNFCNRVTVIGARAFSKTSLSEVKIPASVQLIGTMAFEDQTDAEGNMTLKTVIFEEIDENCAPCQHAQTLIKEEAFLENTAISDVYVNTVVDIDCENHAFPFEVTFAQGDAQAASTGQAATLHFPEGHEAHYVNLNHTLDNETAADPGKFQKWLVEHLAAAKDQSTGYGWYEFINSGSRSTDPDNPDPVYDDNELFLRTFSDANYARIVPDGVRAYIVNHVEKNGTRYELTLQRLSVIPKETGVILFGQPNSTDSEGNAVLTMSAVQFKPGDGQPLRRDYWDVLSTTDQHFKNYLMPIIGKANIRTVEEGGNQTFEETNLLTVYPYEPYKVKGAPVEWRNFALNRLSATENLQGKFEFDASVENYAGFFRILPGTYNEGYAYLHLSADEYDSATGAECVVIEDENYYVEYSTSGDPYDPRSKTGFNWWRNDNKWENMINGWGKRNNDKFDKPGAIQFLGELEDTDGIVKLVIPENKMGEVFSITGMKVTNPNKGIYIQNGKKIIIK